MCVCELSEINFERSSHTWTVQSSLNVICCVLERCQFTLATPQSARENEHCMIITVAFPSHPVLTYTLTLIFVHLFYCLFLILISCLCHCSLNSYSVHTSVYCALSTKQVIIYFITAINTSPGSVFISHEVNMTKMQLVMLQETEKRRLSENLTPPDLWYHLNHYESSMKSFSVCINLTFIFVLQDPATQTPATMEAFVKSVRPTGATHSSVMSASVRLALTASIASTVRSMIF